ncbi:MAG TPA: glycosyltransferase [Verrucomicrobiae bacterium]|nr:glycosyltransferase [Verrucomicrobiae bacterium]
MARAPLTQLSVQAPEMSWVIAHELDQTVSCAGRRPEVRPHVRGKFIFVGDEKFFIRGVTYGTFRPDANGDEFPARDRVEGDFAMMVQNGINAVRTYTPPPRWLLDAAQRRGLRVLVGLPVERSAAFLDYSDCVWSIEQMVREQVRACAGHPAVLGYALGNEIPSSIVRWQGRRRIERFLEHLFCAVKAEDPEGLVTYVNYPSTEYLQLPFLDFVCFNVYLESQERLEAYLGRLHTVAHDRPLVMAELGLDSLRHGEPKQAAVLDWQVRTAFAAGCGGLFVYAWTDQWFRGGAEVHDWKFGLTDLERRPKPALATVRAAFAEVPFPASLGWPKVSVIVCTRNGARTVRDTFEGLRKLEYPDFEVIVVNDGSSDGTALLARQYGFPVIDTSSRGLRSAAPGEENGRDWVITQPNRGLANARNLGLEAATGKIVAYIDDDAYPDPHWLSYLVAAFLNPRTKQYAGVGGPNLAPPGDGLVADCVAHAPGGPIHVLLTNQKAEHIPGCNMAFRKVALKMIGGFDPQFHVAGDDVDVCWSLQQEGWSLGFSPAALVWHHRRNSVRAYWKQQRGYGKAEAMLERKWPEKYNAAGHSVWSGRIYSNGLTYVGWRVRRIYHGQWGTAPYQSLYEPAPNLIESLPMMPEWYLVIFTFAGLSLLGFSWPPLLWTVPGLLIAVSVSVVQAARCALGVSYRTAPADGLQLWKRRALTALLHLLQPLARLLGRLRHGLTFWRRRAVTGFALPRPWTADIWTRSSRSVEERLRAIEKDLRERGWVAVRGGDCDHWDLEVNGGLFGWSRLFLGVECHGSGRQLLRFRSWSRCSLAAGALAVGAAALSYSAGRVAAWTACAVLGATALLIAARMVLECAGATAAFLTVIRKIERDEKIETTDHNAAQRQPH